MKPSRSIGALALFLLAALLPLGGCRAVKTPVANPFDIDRQEFDRVFTAAVLELRDRGFVIDRQDYRFGRITTRPLQSPTIIEPWRGENTTLYQAQTATLNSQRRLITIRLDPAGAPNVDAAATAPATAPAASAPASTPAATSPGGAVAATMPATAPARLGGYQLGVEVYVEQLQITTRRLSGSTRGTAMINTLREVPTELAERGVKPVYWQAVGRDPYFEQRLLTAIIRRSVSVTPGEDRAAPGDPGAPLPPAALLAPAK